MGRRASIGGILLCALCLAPSALHGQQDAGESGVQERGFRLEQNYPNPFNPTTRIPFFLDPALFEGGEPVVVTMRVYNVLQQLVAVPTALNHPLGNGVPVEALRYDEPGRKEAYWDGLDRNGRKVASGVYYLQLIVNNVSEVRKMVVAK